jgi:hypothetical protein
LRGDRSEEEEWKDLDLDGWEILKREVKVTRWRQKALAREEWASVIKKAKALMAV